MTVQNKNLFLLMILFLKFNSLMSNNVSEVAASTVVGATLGYGFYKLFSSFSSSDQLVDNGCKELIKSKEFANQLEIIEQKFKNLSNIEKKEIILSVDETMLESICSAACKKIIDECYLKDLKQNIKNLIYYKEKLPKRIRKLQKIRNKNKYEIVINDMKELICRIDFLLPKLELLNQYINNHLRYFELDEAMDFNSKLYFKELKMFKSKKIFSVDLKRKARLKFNSSLYPLLDYVNKINNDVSKLDNYIVKASKYKNLFKDAQVLKKKLVKIKDFISSDIDYFEEKRVFDKAKAEGILQAGSFMLGTIMGAALSSSDKKDVAIIKDENTEVQPDEEYIIYE